jgi:hypothetical protein
MKKVTVIFNDTHKTKTVYDNIAKVEVHTYGYLELCFANGVSEHFNLNNMFSFKCEKA